MRTMRRRDFITSLVAAPFLLRSRGFAAAQPGPSATATARVRRGDPGWPAAASWEELRARTGGRLIEVHSPIETCRPAASDEACRALFRELNNPYFIGDEVGLTQTTAWVDAWSYAPSVYAVAAESTADVVAAVNFARDNSLRLVVKGGGHSYLGRSNAPDSLLVWTRRMNAIARHDAFVASGCSEPPQPAVSVGAGAIWGHVYNEVTTHGGRYVQGGGCLTVGVAGLVQAGGFGSHSRQFGTAAASLLEAEVVTADGAVRIANACTNPDLFWALRGGGGGSLGVVTRLTLRTHDLPASFGGVFATITATSDAAFRRLVGEFVAFYAKHLLDPKWGEIVTLRPGNRMDIRMSFDTLTQAEAERLWQPFFDWVVAHMPADFGYALFPPIIRTIAARHAWDPAYLKAYAPGATRGDDRPGAPADNVFWAANRAEAGHVIYAYQSRWLPAALLAPERQPALVDALCVASRRAPVELHFQKGLAGAAPDARAATRATAMNPQVLDAFVLAIIGGEAPPAFAGLAGHEPDVAAARKSAGEVSLAMAELKKLAPDAGCYFAESDFFEPDWQRAYWGANYGRLAEVKREYDPAGLFFVHHGVGSEDWSADGFTPK
ncbi:MAG TPA: FAD-dependent oxidoreductase [Xanthobacteraceae bacterium]|nr:FAD-dependent oxidoreductase [Xanthobacteraceae bacterium]